MGGEGSLVSLPEERARMFLHSPDNYHGKGGEHQKRKGKKIGPLISAIQVREMAAIKFGKSARDLQI